MSEIPESSAFVTSEISSAISELGKKWNKIRPKIDTRIEEKWDNLIEMWAKSDTLPLILRKSSEIRGKEYLHTTGRKIIASDNSPAQWVCYLALKNEVPTLDNIHEYLQQDKIPFSYAIKKVDKDRIDYKRILGEYSLSSNKRDWKLCHIREVGINSKTKISKLDLNEVVKKFKNLMKPSNFFLIPKAFGGLGEVKEFICEMR